MPLCLRAKPLQTAQCCASKLPCNHNAVSGSYDTPNISATVHLIAVKYGKGAGAPALRYPSHVLEVHPVLCAGSCMQCTSEVAQVSLSMHMHISIADYMHHAAAV